MSVIQVDPATVLGGGTWEALDDGRVLIGASKTHPAGETGGEETHTLSEAEMPSHDHSGDLSGSTGSAGSHSHTRGNMNIVGGPFASPNGPDSTGALYESGSMAGAPGATGASDSRMMFDASRSWQGSTNNAGSHSHSLDGVKITITSKGEGQAHNNMPPYLSVYMWKRVA